MRQQNLVNINGTRAWTGARVRFQNTRLSNQMKSHRRLCIFSLEVLVNSAEMSVEIIALPRQRDCIGKTKSITARSVSAFAECSNEERVKHESSARFNDFIQVNLYCVEWNVNCALTTRSDTRSNICLLPRSLDVNYIAVTYRLIMIFKTRLNVIIKLLVSMVIILTRTFMYMIKANTKEKKAVLCWGNAFLRRIDMREIRKLRQKKNRHDTCIKSRWLFFARPLWPQYSDRYMKYDRLARSSTGSVSTSSEKLLEKCTSCENSQALYRDLPSPAGGCLRPNARWTKTTILSMRTIKNGFP